ncbi:DUF1145 domain-containing protein [Vibrio rumoiensis]|uniref:DUF1145 domain-containing protein n=1 Tax=Vibrio rumoiensis 1S-45 TaxID=1188252 RepID=A0A1E5E361_9VIBR|nr:DUF1145 domain-containing protein [Vibrio rumoiensis]OEF26113.1 hypothetical protein A1QC_07520 [Vibrio rumoiensis 1S-45]
MKKIMHIVAKLFMLLVWGVFIANLIQPFPGLTHVALNVMAIFMLFMHALQSLLFSGDALGKDVKLTRWEKFSIFLFGTFALIDIKNKYLK